MRIKELLNLIIVPLNAHINKNSIMTFMDKIIKILVFFILELLFLFMRQSYCSYGLHGVTQLLFSNALREFTRGTNLMYHLFTLDINHYLAQYIQRTAWESDAYNSHISQSSSKDNLYLTLTRATYAHVAGLFFQTQLSRNMRALFLSPLRRYRTRITQSQE